LFAKGKSVLTAASFAAAFMARLVNPLGKPAVVEVERAAFAAVSWVVAAPAVTQASAPAAASLASMCVVGVPLVA
jgi:hypothetical protein